MSAWIRVTKQNPCTVCGKPDWDTYCPELGLACCMRIGSSRPAKNGGWIHPLDSTPRPLPPKPDPPRPTIDAEKLWSGWCEATPRSWVEEFASNLGVTAAALVALGCVWASPHRAWCFPMRDEIGAIVGLRLRSDSGKKWAVIGSRQGIFIPDIPRQDTAWICEGPSDTAAVVSLGLFALGRPSCNGCVVQTGTALGRNRIKRAVIVADNDEPGLRGAQFLCHELPIPSCIFVPPCKDMRQALQLGMTKQLVESMVSTLVWNVPEK